MDKSLAIYLLPDLFVTQSCIGRKLVQQIIFSQSSIFHLQKLAHDMHSVSGERHKLSNENSMMRLLKKASLSQDDIVRDDLQRFADNLDAKQISALMSHGIILKKTA